MSLSKSDKDEIKRLIAEALAEYGSPASDTSSIDWEGWEKNGIKSKSTDLIIAPEDYIEGDKKIFTWDEAMAIEQKSRGWRLPTIAEWAHIVAEFGETDEGELDASVLAEAISLGANGYHNGSGLRHQGAYGNYWSRTAGSADDAYGLNFSTNGYFNLQYYNYKYNGFSVRLVKEVK